MQDAPLPFPGEQKPIPELISSIKIDFPEDHKEYNAVCNLADITNREAVIHVSFPVMIEGNRGMVGELMANDRNQSWTVKFHNTAAVRRAPPNGFRLKEFELAMMGGGALCIFIAMTRLAEASTGGKRKEMVQAVWRDPTYIQAVNQDQYDDLGQLTQSQLQMTRPVARASLETERTCVRLKIEKRTRSGRTRDLGGTFEDTCPGEVLNPADERRSHQCGETTRYRC